MKNDILRHRSCWCWWIHHQESQRKSCNHNQWTGSYGRSNKVQHLVFSIFLRIYIKFLFVLQTGLQFQDLNHYPFSFPSSKFVKVWLFQSGLILNFLNLCQAFGIPIAFICWAFEPQTSICTFCLSGPPIAWLNMHWRGSMTFSDTRWGHLV